MSDSQEKSDDLIAELAKLMASNAQGAEPEAKPALKMQPLSEAAVPSAPAPIRIPGMQNASPAAPAAAPTPSVSSSAAPAEPRPAAPTIRIPGMSQPVASAPSAAPAVPPPPPVAAPRPAAGNQFDFGKPPGVAPVIAPEPMNNWQAREVPKPAPQPQSVEPVLTVPLRAAPSEPRIDMPRPMAPLRPALEPRPEAVARPAPVSRPEPVAAPAPVEPEPVAPSFAAGSAPSNAPAGDGFDFDFGFGSDNPPGRSSDEHPAHDPIADLIAAELDAADEVDEAPVVETPKPAPPQARPMQPAPMQPAPMTSTPPQSMPARNFGNPSAAPVLVARPIGSRPAPVPAPRPAPQAQPQMQRSEPDRFAVAPVFGLGSKPAAPAPASRSEPDPMDEIENLIGEAVRVELSPAEKPPTVTLAPPPPPQTKPVVPPLNTAFAPRRAELKDREPPMQSAEAAILAAAAATGARVDHIDSDDRRPVKRMQVKPPKSRGLSGGARQYIGMAVAGTLLLAAGLGLYWVLNMGGAGDPSTAPVLTAEAGSAKQPAPVVASAETAAPAATGLFDQLDGKVVTDPSETLVSRDETEGAAPTEVARVVGSEADDTEGGLANRKVRTVTVRPDGTIVPGDEAVAGNEVLPVDRPSVPAIPGGEIEPSELLASTGAESDAIAAAISGETPVTAAIDPNAVTALVATAPDATAAPGPIDPTIVAPTPMPRPSDRTAMVGGSNRAVELAPAIEAVTPTPAAAAPAAEVTTGGSGPYVQIAAQRSEGDALASLNNAQARYGSLFEGKTPYIQRADLGQKGIYYRVRIPAATLQEASSICSSIKANGGDCMASGG